MKNRKRKKPVKRYLTLREIKSDKMLYKWLCKLPIEARDVVLGCLALIAIAEALPAAFEKKAQEKGTDDI